MTIAAASPGGSPRARRRCVAAAGDADLLLRADDQVAVRQAFLQSARDGPRREALLAGSGRGEAPEHGAVIDVEHGAHAVGACPAQGLQHGGARRGLERCVPVTARRRSLRSRPRRSPLPQAHVGAVVTEEDVRVAARARDAEHHEAGQALRIGATWLTSTPSRASCSRTKRPMCSSPTRVSIAERGRAARARPRGWPTSRRGTSRTSACPRAGRRAAGRRDRPPRDRGR